MPFTDILEENVIVLFVLTLFSLLLNLILGVQVSMLKSEVARLKGGSLTREELELLKSRLTRLKKLTR
ncbi:MAG: hypothetical protein U9N35_08165 [Euryarchaeota archaeon]|nr:hypothetical protein [Euryarchaeota archaeon]